MTRSDPMTHDELMSFCDERIARGQRRLATAARVSLATREPDLYPHVADAGDRVFLEPLLFAYLATRESPVPVSQILFGALPPQARPDAVDVRADRHGRIHVPSVGTFTTDAAGRDLTLSFDRTDGRYRLEDQGQPVPRSVPFLFEPPLLVPGTAIEVLRHPDPLMETVFPDRVAAEIGDAPLHHLEHLRRALALIAALDPAYHRQIAATTRRIVVYRSAERVSFAALAAHGTAFFGPRPEDGEIFFLDDIAHQCGHVVFNAMTARRSDFLREPDHPLGALSGQAGDHRTLYTALHGFFTEYHMCRLLDLCDGRRLVGAEARLEVVARLAFIAEKYLQDASNLDRDVYAPDGQVCFETIRDAAVALRRARADLWALNMAGQPYVFDYPLFRRHNDPLEASA